MTSERGAAKVPISFSLNDRSPEKKTDAWEVWRLDRARHVGQVRWNSPQRKYCFFPASGTAWDEDLLRFVAEFIEAETVKHRKGKRAFAEASA